MIIIIKSNPYSNENTFGALFIALSAAKAEERVEVIFVEKGLLGLFTNESETLELKLPVISDIIQQFVGTVYFYFVLPYSEISYLSPKFFVSNKISGIKELNYDQLCEKILKNGKNLIVL